MIEPVRRYLLVVCLCLALPLFGQDEDYDYLDSDMCMDCHEESEHGTDFNEDLEVSAHEGFECLDCHTDKDTDPHREDLEFEVGCQGCRDCHEEVSDEYVAHGRSTIGKCSEMPMCSDCHGDHDILPSDVKASKTHPSNVANSCGKCHEDLDLVERYEIMFDHPVDIYQASVHGKATEGGVLNAATCNDCHGVGSSAHMIYSPNHPESAINHSNIPQTCGKCHPEETEAYLEGIHGKMAARGRAGSPVCTDCHGEHGIIAPSDPDSPVSKHRVAAATCEPCHESAVVNERLGVSRPGEVHSYVDSYHGLKSEAGDITVANCESCHGAHRILPSSDSTSTIHPNNLSTTCGECHPGISTELASIKIHDFEDTDPRVPLAILIEKIYILLIAVVIGGMFLHTLLDYLKQVRMQMQLPSVRRMRAIEVVQHTALLGSFFVLVISGFALRFNESFLARFFFGWEGGFEMRGVIHRYAAVIMIITSVWHLLFLFTVRGRQFFKDMVPSLRDFKEFGHMVLWFFDKEDHEPRFGRFAYMEKAEYWAGLWGNIVMIATGLILWFDNYFIQAVSKGLIDVALVIHYWEAWLAFLAIMIWHLYNTIFRPSVAPMNTSWLTGRMPRAMFDHEHGGTEPDPDINRDRYTRTARETEDSGEGSAES